jgi:hypothetical protein
MNMKTTLVLLLVLLALPAAAPAQERPRDIEIRSFEIALADLDRPETRTDADGVKRTFGQVYIVELKGDFGEPGAIPVDVYIGDHKIEEYGGTRDGIYFKVYDEALFDRLEGKRFAYGFEGQKVETLDLRFTARGRKPFKRINWPSRPKE